MVNKVALKNVNFNYLKLVDFMVDINYITISLRIRPEIWKIICPIYIIYLNISDYQVAVSAYLKNFTLRKTFETVSNRKISKSVLFKEENDWKIGVTSESLG